MDGFSVRFYDAPEVEVGSCDLRVPVMVGDDPTLPELAEGWRFETQTRRDDALFEAWWFGEFRDQWKRDLAAHRDQYRARLQEIN